MNWERYAARLCGFLSEQLAEQEPGRGVVRMPAWRLADGADPVIASAACTAEALFADQPPYASPRLAQAA